MSDGKGGDGGQQTPPAIDQKRQGQHGQQVVYPQQDMIDAQFEIRPDDSRTTRERFSWLWHRPPNRGRQPLPGPHAVVQEARRFFVAHHRKTIWIKVNLLKCDPFGLIVNR